jgi:hypothetical protein
LSSLPASPHTFSGGEFATATNLDTLTNNLLYLLGAAASPKPYCSVFQTGGQSITAATVTTITFNNETKDTEAMHTNTGSNQNITIITPGLYDVRMGVQFATNSASGSRAGYIFQNATEVAANTSAAATITSNINCSVFLQCVALDVLTAGCYTTTASALSAGASATWFQALWVSE